MIRMLLSRLLRVGACLLGVILFLSGCPSIHTVIKPPPTRSSPLEVAALGQIAPRNGILLINAPLGEQVTEVLVGDTAEVWSVKKGQKLVALRSEELRRKEVELAKAQLQAVQQQRAALKASGAEQVREAELKRDNLVASAGADIASLDLKVGLLQDQYEAARKEETRLNRFASDTVSDQVKINQKLAAEAARVTLESTKLALEQSKNALLRNKEEANARIQVLKKTLAQAEAQLAVKAAQINADLANTRYEVSLIRSPIDGEVLDVAINKGDVASGQPLMRLADLSNLIVIAEVDQSDVLRVRPGATALITSSVLKETLGIGPIAGTVRSIRKMIAPNKLNSLNPAARSDRRVVEATIDLAGLEKLTKDQREDLERMVGLQVEVKINVTKKPGSDNE